MVALPAMIEPDGIPGEQAPHYGRQGDHAGAQEHMRMIRHQRPGVTNRLRFGQKPRQPGEEILPILVVPDDVPPFDTADHDVVEHPWRVKPSLAWHGPLDAPSRHQC